MFASVYPLYSDLAQVMYKLNNDNFNKAHVCCMERNLDSVYNYPSTNLHPYSTNKHYDISMIIWQTILNSIYN